MHFFKTQNTFVKKKAYLCVSFLLSHYDTHNTTLLTPERGFPARQTVLYDTNWVSCSHFSPDTIYPELALDPTNEGLSAMKLPPLYKSQAITSEQSAINQGSYDPLLRLSNLLKHLTELRETLTFISLLYNKEYWKRQK